MRTILKLALFLVIGLLAYNYFYGTIEEKEQSRQIVDKARDLGSEAWNLLKGEREKMRQGKYDDALDKLENLYGSLREEAQDLSDSKLIRDIEDLTERRTDLERALEKGGDLSRAAQEKLDELTADTEELMNEMEAKSKSGAPR
ncbi:hypothetical protein [Lewinella sp. IMCC34191]|uniref:hypothetical protein n=1 Tax=Lewinella sp. IMCC34191 TaxID=2259172 RepID=UPI000E24A12E|nr:hypothetical protein [Lewinella sp. IMCC34191]